MDREIRPESKPSKERASPAVQAAAEAPADIRPATLQTPAQEGKSFGQIAWERFKRDRQAVVGALLVLFMTACGVFAPLLANNLPYIVDARRPDLYETAFATIWFDSYRELDAIESGEQAAFSERHLQNIEQNLARMRRLLASGDTQALAAFSRQLDQLLARSTPPVEELRALFEENEERFDSYNGDLDYAVVRTYPALRALKWGEVLFMVLFLALLAGLPLRGWLGGPWRVWAGAFVLAGLAATLWAWVFPPRTDPGLYKQFQQQGLVEFVIYPPVPFGENENILEDTKMTPYPLQVTPARAKRQAENAYRRALSRWERLPPGEQGEKARPQPEDFAVPASRVAPVWFERDGQPVYRKHWLGTDATGRDLLARMIYGARIAMSIGVVAVSIYATIGIIIGAMAGYFGGWIDLAVSRFIEVVICFPAFFLILIIISFVGSSIFWVMIVIGLTGWTGIARLTRGEFLRLNNLDFVHAVRAAGGSDLRIIGRHVLPNAIQPVLVSASFGIAAAILIESGLSYLGFGVQPPFASWGELLHQARADIRGMWWMTIFPGMAIFITVTAFNLVGEAVRDALDPKMIEKE